MTCLVESRPVMSDVFVGPRAELTEVRRHCPPRNTKGSVGAHSNTRMSLRVTRAIHRHFSEASPASGGAICCR